MRRFALGLLLSSSLAAGALGCGGEDEPAKAPAAAHAPTPLPPLDAAPLTTDQTLRATHDRVEATLNPQLPADMTTMLDEGYGATALETGAALEQRTLEGAAAPAPGPGAKLLARFVHLADTQLADDESPARLAAFDLPVLGGAYRPQEGHECRILNAAVRTINAVHAAKPLDFVLLGGDNVDNAQSNELDWFQAVLDGKPSVECDSGADDDPVAGPDNDAKDPFVAEGLAVPWRWVTGNHDVCVQGFQTIDNYADVAIGAYSANGARDWSLPGAPVVKGDVVADPARELLTRSALLAKVRGAGDGHGIEGGAEALGKAYYAFDVEGTPLRILVVDSSAETGGSDGVIHQADVDAFLTPALDEAKVAGKWVIVTSHHASGSLSDGGDVGGTAQADALSVEGWRELLSGYDNVIMHLAGHSHVHKVTRVEPAAGGRAYWELQTAALADFPNEMRLLEIWDQDDGFVSIRGVGIDYAVDDDPVATDGRSRAVVDFTSGWSEDGRGEVIDRNVELWIAKPL